MFELWYITSFHITQRRIRLHKKTEIYYFTKIIPTLELGKQRHPKSKRHVASKKRHVGAEYIIKHVQQEHLRLTTLLLDTSQSVYHLKIQHPTSLFKIFCSKNVNRNDAHTSISITCYRHEHISVFMLHGKHKG